MTIIVIFVSAYLSIITIIMIAMFGDLIMDKISVIYSTKNHCKSDTLCNRLVYESCRCGSCKYHCDFECKCIPIPAKGFKLGVIKGGKDE